MARIRMVLQSELTGALAGAVLVAGLVLTPATVAWSQSTATPEPMPPAPSVEAAPSGGLPILNTLGQQMSGLNTTIGAMAKQLGEKTEQIEALKADITKQESALKSLRESLSQKESLVAELQATIEESSGSLETVQGDLAASRAEIDRLTAAAEDGKKAVEELATVQAELVRLQEENEALATTAQEAEAALQQGTEKLQAERDALSSQRFWLAILAVLALGVAGFFAMRGRGKSAS